MKTKTADSRFDDRNITIALAAALVSGGVLLMAGQAFAGDATAGEKVFKKCAACHTVDGSGKKKAGPDLQGIMSRNIGAVEHDFTDGFKAIADKGIPWGDDNMNAYLEDPTAFVQGVSGDPAAKSKMRFKLSDPADRENVIAYMKTL